MGLIGKVKKRLPDHFYKKAKQQGFVARSVYKLETLDKKYKLFKSNQKILDLGASPGSWLQYLSEKVGNRGRIVGVDINPLNIDIDEPIHFYQCDVFSNDLVEILKPYGLFDLIISDMAPKTTGQKDRDHLLSMQLCERSFDLAKERLKPNGVWLCKMFQGGESEDFIRQRKQFFEVLKVQKPSSSRKESREVFLVGQKYKPS